MQRHFIIIQQANIVLEISDIYDNALGHMYAQYRKSSNILPYFMQREGHLKIILVFTGQILNRNFAMTYTYIHIVLHTHTVLHSLSFLKINYHPRCPVEKRCECIIKCMHASNIM